MKIPGTGKDNRNARGRLHRGLRRRSPVRHDQIRLERDQFRGLRVPARRHALCEARFDYEVFSFDIAQLLQLVSKRAPILRLCIFLSIVEDCDLHPRPAGCPSANGATSSAHAAIRICLRWNRLMVFHSEMGLQEVYALTPTRGRLLPA